MNEKLVIDSERFCQIVAKLCLKSCYFAVWSLRRRVSAGMECLAKGINNMKSLVWDTDYIKPSLYLFTAVCVWVLRRFSRRGEDSTGLTTSYPWMLLGTIKVSAFFLASILCPATLPTSIIPVLNPEMIQNGCIELYVKHSINQYPW